MTPVEIFLTILTILAGSPGIAAWGERVIKWWQKRDERKAHPAEPSKLELQERNDVTQQSLDSSLQAAKQWEALYRQVQIDCDKKIAEVETRLNARIDGLQLELIRSDGALRYITKIAADKHPIEVNIALQIRQGLLEVPKGTD